MFSSENTIETRIEDFKVLNEVSRGGGVVFFGSNYFSRMNVNELANDCEMFEKLYDRSVAGLVVSDSFKLLESAVYDLNPAKIFLNIGDADCLRVGFSEEAFLEKYEWLLLNLHRGCKAAKIYIVSVVSEAKAAPLVNRKLRQLASDTGCTFIDITAVAFEEYGFEKAFNMLKPYMRSFHVKFAQAMG